MKKATANPGGKAAKKAPSKKAAVKLKGKPKKTETPGEKKETPEKTGKKIKSDADKAAAKKKGKIKAKLHPVFRGRFGCRMKRKIKKAKWNKWRVPRGIDIKLNQEDGAYPKTGYRTRKDIRDLHPSGYPEALVNSLSDIGNLNGQSIAVRIGSTVGRRKKLLIVDAAEKKGLKIINR